MVYIIPLMQPDFSFETELYSQGFTLIAGVDEVGRGPLAGPVVAAAVILDPNNIPDGLNDSKKLKPKQREKLFELILTSSHVGISSIPARMIDQINILQASLMAMRLALKNLPKYADYALIDGNKLPLNLSCEAQAIIKGDAICLSISAASIVAKVVRDAMMAQANLDFAGYHFASNKGYGSAAHLEGIEQFGACPLHRLSFAPLNIKPRLKKI
jgi:ribonuclease HII